MYNEQVQRYGLYGDTSTNPPAEKPSFISQVTTWYKENTFLAIGLTLGVGYLVYTTFLAKKSRRGVSGLGSTKRRRKTSTRRKTHRARKITA